MESALLKFENVTKKNGHAPVFSDFSFEIPESGVYAVLGKKGTGKTTLMNIAAGCMRPDSGKVFIAGQNAYENAVATRRKVSYLPQNNCFFPEMTCLELLLFIGDAKGVDRERLYKKIDEVVEIAGLEDVTERLVGQLDIINMKRLGIAASVIGNPDLIIFDGLFDGIPRKMAGEFKTLVKMFGEMKPVLVGLSCASNLLEICDGVIDLGTKTFIPASDFPSRASFAERFTAYLPQEDPEAQPSDSAPEKIPAISKFFKKSKVEKV